MFSSPEDICLVSDNGSRLDFPELTSPVTSDVKGNTGLPDDVPNNRRTTGTSEDGIGKLKATALMGWSNLQVGPNLQIP